MTGGGRDHPEQHPDRRRFAGAIQPEERIDLARGHRQIHLVNCQDIAA